MLLRQYYVILFILIGSYLWFIRGQTQTTSSLQTTVTHSAITSCATFLLVSHFDAICDLLLNRRTTTWNLFVKKITHRSSIASIPACLTGISLEQVKATVLVSSSSDTDNNDGRISFSFLCLWFNMGSALCPVFIGAHWKLTSLNDVSCKLPTKSLYWDLTTRLPSLIQCFRLCSHGNGLKWIMDPILEQTTSVNTEPFRLWTLAYKGPVSYGSVLDRSEQSCCF